MFWLFFPTLKISIHAMAHWWSKEQVVPWRRFTKNQFPVHNSPHNPVISCFWHLSNWAHIRIGGWYAVPSILPQFKAIAAKLFILQSTQFTGDAPSPLAYIFKSYFRQIIDTAKLSWPRHRDRKSNVSDTCQLLCNTTHCYQVMWERLR